MNASSGGGHGVVAEREMKLGQDGTRMPLFVIPHPGPSWTAATGLPPAGPDS